MSGLTLRQFLDTAHFVLTEEVIRLGQGKLNLEQALDATKSWAAGRSYETDDEPVIAESPAGGASQRQQGPRQKTEEEMVAQNEAAMAALGARLQTVSGLGRFMRN